MGDLITFAIFIIIAIASAAQKMSESKQKKIAQAHRAERANARSQESASSGGGVRQARPKGAARGESPAALDPSTTGKDLINALFGEGTTESMEGWTNVAPAPAAKKPAPAVTRQQPREEVRRVKNPGNAREAALRQREAMEQQYARDNDHSTRGHAQGISHQEQRPQQRQAQQRQRQQTEQERQRILAERQRRQAQQQRQQKAQQQRVPRRGVVAPVARGGIVPRSLPDVRRAIVMAEILGPPKAFE